MSCISWLYSLRFIPYYGPQSGSYSIAKAGTRRTRPRRAGFCVPGKMYKRDQPPRLSLDEIPDSIYTFIMVTSSHPK